MEDKTRKLIVSLEVLALVVSALLILIDYKLKRDLLTLFIQIEKRLYGQTSFAQESADTSRDSGLRGSDMVGEPTGVAETGNTEMASSNGHASVRPIRKPKRTTGARDQSVSEPDKPVGP